jgi:hypothetical protein
MSDWRWILGRPEGTEWNWYMVGLGLGFALGILAVLWLLIAMTIAGLP